MRRNSKTVVLCLSVCLSKTLLKWQYFNKMWYLVSSSNNIPYQKWKQPQERNWCHKWWASQKYGPPLKWRQLKKRKVTQKKKMTQTIETTPVIKKTQKVRQPKKMTTPRIQITSKIQVTHKMRTTWKMKRTPNMSITVREHSSITLAWFPHF